MAIGEKRFLIKKECWKKHVHKSIMFRQAYLGNFKGVCTRVRITDNQAMVMIKDAYLEEQNMAYTYEIPLVDAEALIDRIDTQVLSNIQHHIAYEGINWEVYEFLGVNAGLIIAVVKDCDDDTFVKPKWVGKEITNDKEYENAVLIDKPYTKWP